MNRSTRAAIVAAASFALTAAVLVLSATDAGAKTLRWAGRGDMQTTDPHSQNENLTNNINQLIYEFLLVRDKKLNLLPALAESWTKVNDTTWRFKLRPGVKFHDGTPFTADDVVFSFERARSDTSQLRAYANASGIPKKIDDLTVEFTTNGPNPIELEHIATINIMSKAWCEKNRAVKPQNYTQKEDMITAHEANGTGPYMLKSREPDVKTVLTKNPNWWGLKDKRFEGNADEVIYTPIVSDATRVAALCRARSTSSTTRRRRTFRAFRRRRASRCSKAPRTDRVHRHGPGPRRALVFERERQEPVQGQARPASALPGGRHRSIKKNTMRGLSQPSARCFLRRSRPRRRSRSGCRTTRRPRRSCWPRQGTPTASKVTLDCPNNRYVNDEKICQALAAMWAQIGVKVAVNAMPRATYFPKLEKTDTSMYMLGWGGATTDGIFVLQPVLSTYNGKGDGDYNYGRYTNAKLDELTAKIKVNMKEEERLGQIHDALLAHNAEVNHIVLHRQVIPWAARSNVTAVHRADNNVIPYWVEIK
jgi:peptide/nickel transport system substrate-binding protein